MSSKYSIGCRAFSYDPDTKVVYRVLGFIGCSDYKVGSNGDVLSRLVMGSRFGRIGEWRKLKPRNSGQWGYLGVTLYGCENEQIRYYVHRLVLEAFVGPCPEGMECRHLDGNPKSNDLVNLCWGTPKENAKDSFEHGSRILGERHYLAKMTIDMVKKMRELWDTGRYSLSALKHIFDVDCCLQSIHKAMIRKTWKSVV